MVQLVRTPACHAGGRGFESLLGRLGRIAQLGEHLPYKQGVTGSSPVAPTLKSSSLYKDLKYKPLWLIGFKKVCFKKYLYADVAQLAEQLTCNQQVIGSSPIVGF